MNIRSIVREELLREQSFDMEMSPVKDIPPLLYHTESASNRRLVKRRGLVPTVGDSFALHWDWKYEPDTLPKCVFLSDYIYDSCYNDDVYEVDALQLDRDKMFADIDDTMEGSFMYMGIIPPSALKLIKQGDVNDGIGRFLNKDWYVPE